MREVRDWLQAASGLRGLPGGGEMVSRYAGFQAELPAICAAQRVEADRLTFLDLSNAIGMWLGDER